MTICENQGCEIEIPSVSDTVTIATDDWPYLYLEKRSIPLQYWIVLLVVVGIAWFSTRRVFDNARNINSHFFFLGGAFLLIEFKSITELALLFGSTWIVNSVAVSAVLMMVLFANLIVSRLARINMNTLYLLLAVSLLISFLTPLDHLLAYGILARAVGAGILLGMPIFFSSAIFATSLKGTNDVVGAFASNFLGSALGGILEYGSLAFGIKSLYLIGAILYIVSWMTSSQGRLLPVWISNRLNTQSSPTE